LQVSRMRAPGERPFAVIKTVFKAAHVLVTTVGRVHIKMVFTAFAYNLYQLRNSPQSRCHLAERMLSKYRAKREDKARD